MRASLAATAGTPSANSACRRSGTASARSCAFQRSASNGDCRKAGRAGLDRTFISFSVDADAFGLAELFGAGDHDAVAGLQAFEDFHRVQAAGADADVALDRAAAVHHPGAAA